MINKAGHNDFPSQITERPPAPAPVNQGAASKAGGDYVAAVACHRYQFDYVNYRGEKSHRDVTAVSYRYGSSEWHSEPQWLMMAIDHDKNQPREFAMCDMDNIVEELPFPVVRPGENYQSPLRDLIMRLDLVAQSHIAYSQASDALYNLRDHLSAIAFCEEVNRRDDARAAG